MNITRLSSHAGFVFVVLAGCLLLARPAAATNAVVGDGTPGSCTEAEFDAALAQVSIYVTGIVFDCGGPATIIFTSHKIINTQLLEIDGGGEITLSGANSTRLFYVQSAAGTVVFSNITLTNGFSGDAYGGAIFAEQNTSVIVRNSTIQNSRTGDGYAGGAICSFATGDQPAVTIENSLIRGNTSEYAAVNTIGKLTINNSSFEANFGGGLSVGGTTEIVDSTFTRNYGRFGGAIRVVAGTTEMTRGYMRENVARITDLDFGGGAAYVYASGNLLLTEVDVASNRSQGAVGAIYNRGSAILDGVTLRDNYAEYGGGGVLNAGQMAAYNSTFSGNSARVSGSDEFENRGTLEIIHSTIIGHGVVVSNEEVPSTVLRFKSTIVVGDRFGIGSCIGKPATSSDFSLYLDSSCPWTAGSGNIIANYLEIAVELADNGGPTLTLMPSASSHVIDAGQCYLAVDQRGVSRPQGPACDIGSVERRPNEQGGQQFLFLPMLMK